MKSRLRKAPKVYICDTGLANHITKVDAGLLFENSVFQNLRLKGELNYYQKKSGVEIDFVLNKRTAYEVKMAPYGSDIRRLKALSLQIGLKDFKVVSKTYSTLEHVIYGFMIEADGEV